MNREKKIRAWNIITNTMHENILSVDNWSFSFLDQNIFIWLDWTGLKDKNNIPIYEGDEVDTNITIRGLETG